MERRLCAVESNYKRPVEPVVTKDLKLLRIIIPCQGLLGALHIEDVQEQLVLLADRVLIRLVGGSIEREVWQRVSHHVLAEDFLPDRLVHHEDVFQVLLGRI